MSEDEQLKGKISELKALSNLIAASGIGELNEYLMDKGIGLVGDMTAKVALDHIKSLEAELAKRPVVYVRVVGGIRREAQNGYPVLWIPEEVAVYADQSEFEPYTGESE